MRQFARAFPIVLIAVYLGTAQSSIVSLTEALQKYLGTPDKDARRTRFSVSFVDLKEDGNKEAIVYLSSNGWCGTAGCTMLILAPQGTSFRVVSKIPGVRLPIRVLGSKTQGWRDIGVVGRKSGTEPLYESVLSFNGTSYPDVSDGDDLHGKVKGEIVMPETVKSNPL